MKLRKKNEEKMLIGDERILEKIKEGMRGRKIRIDLVKIKIEVLKKNVEKERKIDKRKNIVLRKENDGRLRNGSYGKGIGRDGKKEKIEKGKNFGEIGGENGEREKRVKKKERKIENKEFRGKRKNIGKGKRWRIEGNSLIENECKVNKEKIEKGIGEKWGGGEKEDKKENDEDIMMKMWIRFNLCEDKRKYWNIEKCKDNKE